MSEPTRVGHCKRDPTDVYVGRGPGGRNMHETPIGDRGWLGNPYTLEDYPRDVSVESFEKDFIEGLQNDDDFTAAVEGLAGKTLGCWCQGIDDDGPRCHGEVIAEWADRLAARDEVDDA